MSFIVETLMRCDATPAFELTRRNNVVLARNPFENTLQAYDRQTLGQVAEIYGGDGILTYTNATEEVPYILFQDEILNTLIARSGHIHNPERISTVGLQIGTDGFHHVHRLHFTDFDDAYVVSFVSRSPSESEFGMRFRSEFDNIKLLHAQLQNQPKKIRDVIDVVEPIVFSTFSRHRKKYQVMFTKFEEEVGELNATALATRGLLSKPEVQGQVINYAIPYTQEMYLAASQQGFITQGFMGNQKQIHWERAAEIMKLQWMEVAFSLAVLGVSVQRLPSRFKFNAGDLMGVIRLATDPKDFPHIGRCRLASVKGPLTYIGHSEHDIERALRQYYFWPKMAHEQNELSVGLFSMLSRDDMQNVIGMAKEYVYGMKK